MSVKNSNQIARVEGAGKFVEALNDSFSIGKVWFNLSEYDKQTHVRKNILPFYIDTMKVLVLAENMLSGRFSAMVDKAIADKTFEGQAVSPYTSYFSDRGGISEEKVHRNFEEMKKKYPFVTDGEAIARMFKIQKATNAGLDWIVRVEYGPGKSNDKGLIVPSGSAPTYINVAMSHEDMCEMLMAIKLHYAAYLNNYYSRFGEKMFPNETCNLFTPDKKN